MPLEKRTDDAACALIYEIGEEIRDPNGEDKLQRRSVFHFATFVFIPV